MNLEVAEAELNRYLDRAAAKTGEARAGQEAANALEAVWAASERRELAKRREENRTLWVQHLRRTAAAHLRIARSARARARVLEAGES